jgi:hypothetical protein
MNDEAKALSEVARTTGKAIDALRDTGSYLAGVFGSVPRDLVGVGGGDWLFHQRRRHLAKLEAATLTIVKQYEPERRTEPSPSVVLPLFGAAADEAREELQQLWAALLANTMLDGGVRVRRDFIETLRQLEPFDALVLDIFARFPRSDTMNVDGRSINAKFVEEEKRNIHISEDDYSIS